MEYSDTECPFCAQLHPSITKVQQEYADKISFVYRYFPLTQIHPHSFEESRAVYCVGKLSGAAKREEYINTMFSYKLSKQNMVLPETGANSKEDMAKNTGVNMNDFGACMLSQESSDAINAALQDGTAAGVTGTPATFILVKNKKGYDVVAQVDGARPYEFLKAAIDQALAR
jgi:protein-disulfide isomerase